MRPKPLKLFESQGANGQRIKRLNEIRMGSSLFFRCRQPFAGIALLFADNIVYRVKRHAAVDTRNVRLHPLLAFIAVKRVIASQIVALANIVHQFLHQNGGEALAVVLNGAADIADIELTLSRDKRFKEEIAVIIATATVTPLWICAHQIEPQRCQGTRINTVVHAEQTDHLKGN